MSIVSGVPMRISVIGGGYVGLVSSVCLAELGHSVNLIEIDDGKVAYINSGRSTIFEEGLEEMLAKHINCNLKASSDFNSVLVSDITFICVGTPSSSNGSADLSMIKSASISIGHALRGSEKYHVIATKSTVPPGTTQDVVMPLVLKESCLKKQNIGFVMNPEFLREGRAIHDFMRPDRIVIGSDDKKAGDLVETAYSGLNAPIVRTGLTAAEMVKYASNAFLATKISFSNEIGNICKKLSIDVYEVMNGVGLDHRINPHFLNAGVGFGGSCFPKDVSALIHLAECLREDPILLKSVMKINDLQPKRLVDLLEKRIGSLRGKRVAVLGLAFKDNTDDIRDSRSINVILDLIKRGVHIAAYDPKANDSMHSIIPDIDYCHSAAEALNEADACLVMTEWPQFNSLDKEFDLMKSRVIIEGRRILSCNYSEGICW
jgi:UDPglucose 6-dehydrogenase